MKINFNDKPKGFKVLAILTFISITLSILGVLGSFSSGPLKPTQLKQQHYEISLQIDQAKKMGSDFLVDFWHRMDVIIDQTNNHFYLALGLKLVYSLIGFLAIYWMWNRNKLGFHIYIFYSLFEVIQQYFISPAHVIPWLMVVMQLAISTIFILLYAKHLKWISGGNADEFTVED